MESLDPLQPMDCQVSVRTTEPCCFMFCLGFKASLFNILLYSFLHLFSAFWSTNFFLMHFLVFFEKQSSIAYNS